MSYGIRDGYLDRPNNAFFDDTGLEDEWQREVYEIAADIAKSTGANSVADIGCGSGFKLIKYFSHLKTVGFDLGPTVDFLQKRYPNKEWRQGDFNSTVEPFDIVICSDVVEHIPNPDLLMTFLQRINLRYLIISTPEREVAYGHDHSGPPHNRAHCREWLMTEFVEYVYRWFDVREALITNREQATQALVCIPRSRWHPPWLRRLRLTRLLRRVRKLGQGPSGRP